MNIPWETVRHEFDFDGSWRDIYVFGTDMADWQRMLDSLSESAYQVEYFRDDQLAEIPASAVQALSGGEQCNCLLSVTFAGVLANCHFFTAEEIEFDIDPREIKGQQQFDAHIGFVRWLADSVGKETILTPEGPSSLIKNSPSTVIFRVRPGTAEVEYTPSWEK